MRSFLTWRLPSVLALALLLADCGSGPRDTTNSSNLSFRPEDVAARACPTVTVLGDATTITKYRSGRGRDLTDVVLEGRVTDAHGECTFNRHDMTMAMTVAFDFVIGPANRDHAISASYFVAIVDAQSNVVAREELPIQLQAPVNQSRVIFNEELEPRIPFRERTDLVGYRIFVGLVLTPEEVRFNRSRRPQQ
jgi:hypothetical protein